VPDVEDRRPAVRRAAHQVLRAERRPVGRPGDRRPRSPLEVPGPHLHPAQLRGGLAEPGCGGRRGVADPGRGVGGSGRPPGAAGGGNRRYPPGAQFAAEQVVRLRYQRRGQLGQAGQLAERFRGVAGLRPAAGCSLPVQQVPQARRRVADPGDLVVPVVRREARPRRGVGAQELPQLRARHLVHRDRVQRRVVVELGREAEAEGRHLSGDVLRRGPGRQRRVHLLPHGQVRIRHQGLSSQPGSRKAPGRSHDGSCTTIAAAAYNRRNARKTVRVPRTGRQGPPRRCFPRTRLPPPRRAGRVWREHVSRPDDQTSPLTNR
jgi:hypothetical protein